MLIGTSVDARTPFSLPTIVNDWLAAPNPQKAGLEQMECRYYSKSQVKHTVHGMGVLLGFA
jgi:hypothetical protein